MADINAVLEDSGQEMAMFPSTLDIATIGGFVAGGSSGIGSLASGALREPGNLIELKALSLEAEPKEYVFHGEDVLKIHHAWGLNGAITEVKLRTVPSRDWVACMATFDNYEACYSAGYAVATSDKIAPKLAIVLGQKLAAQSVPVLGAIAGGGTNYVYTRYYQQVARVHFGLRRLAIDADIPHEDLVRKLAARL